MDKRIYALEFRVHSPILYGPIQENYYQSDAGFRFVSNKLTLSMCSHIHVVRCSSD